MSAWLASLLLITRSGLSPRPGGQDFLLSPSAARVGAAACRRAALCQVLLAENLALHFQPL